MLLALLGRRHGKDFGFRIGDFEFLVTEGRLRVLLRKLSSRNSKSEISSIQLAEPLVEYRHHRRYHSYYDASERQRVLGSKTM